MVLRSIEYVPQTIAFPAVAAIVQSIAQRR
jgi:hypothetical protein